MREEPQKPGGGGGGNNCAQHRSKGTTLDTDRQREREQPPGALKKAQRGEKEPLSESQSFFQQHSLCATAVLSQFSSRIAQHTLQGGEKKKSHKKKSQGA